MFLHLWILFIKRKFPIFIDYKLQADVGSLTFLVTCTFLHLLEPDLTLNRVLSHLTIKAELVLLPPKLDTLKGGKLSHFQSKDETD